MATAVRLDPVTGMPKVRVVAPAKSATPAFASAGPPRIPDTTTLSGDWRYGAPAGSYTIGGDYGLFHAPAAPAAPAPAAGGGVGGGGAAGGGGGPINYQSLIENDPGFKALKAELAAGNISAAQFRKAAVQRAIIAFGASPDTGGLDPQSLGYFNEDVDQLTKDLAAKNTSEGLSTTAQLQRAHSLAVNGLRNTLAARGMLQSGATGVGLGLEEQRNKEETTGKTRELLDYLSGQAAAYAEHLHQSKLQEAQGLMSTTQAYFGMAGGLGGGGGGGEGGGGAGGGLVAPGGWGAAGSTYGADVISQTAWQMAQQRGWTHPVGSNELELQQNGQVFTDESGRRYVMVKFGTPEGNSTERVYLPEPGTQSAAAAAPAAAPSTALTKSPTAAATPKLVPAAPVSTPGLAAALATIRRPGRTLV